MEDIIKFARERGDFEHPAFLEVRATIPTWLSELGTEKGMAQFESEYQVTLSSTVKFYIQHPDIASIIETGCDLDAFLNQMASCVGAVPPFVLYCDRHAHLERVLKFSFDFWRGVST